jgi:hypothetical protein
MRHGRVAHADHFGLAQKDEAAVGRMIGGAEKRLAR